MIPIYWIPLIPFLTAMLILFARFRELNINRAAMTGVILFNLLTFYEVFRWFGEALPEFKQPLFHWDDYQFDFTLRMDHVSAVFLCVTVILGALVVRFSHYYMHREPGQTRFFSTLLLFLAGMSAVELAGDIDTLFMGWELVGISSFMLIGFYRHREFPVRNALKVYTIYRICDIGLLVGAYLQHHDYGGTDFKLLLEHHLPAQVVLPVALLLLLSAAGKSGQFPFSFWIPRAMEGPTPSSAIFYGALSIHAGVFLLMRTTPIWMISPLARVCIGVVGLTTALLATLLGHVQSNIKGQVGYGSVTQVGIMFVELALGFDKLVLVHFVGNASLRCYQLLVSPSVVAYLLKLQSTASHQAKFSDFSIERLLPNNLRSSLFVLASQEAFMEPLLNRVVFWFPQWIARHVFGENKTILEVWTRSVAIALVLVICIAAGLGSPHVAIPFLAGLLASYAIGVIGVMLLPADKRNLVLDRPRGMALQYPISARLLFLSFLGMSGFPITPAFFGEDLLLSSAIHLNAAVAIGFTVLFIMNGIVLARTFTRMFLGKEWGRWAPALEA
ncbi:MAG: proton-conducting transporter membrane subunit [Vulcanimicrobiota bacterium]